MLISLCMIVKNEAPHLERCLESVQGLVHEIWIADTGSEDATPEIARRFTPHVWQIPWQDDFAWARNQAMAQARGDWILVLDADEWLPEETVRGLPCFISQQDPTVPRVFNFLVQTPGEQPLFTRALFPNLPGFAFKGRVHETLRWHGLMPELIHCPQWIIGHEPGDSDKRKIKAALYLPLIEAELAEKLSVQEQVDYLFHKGQTLVLLEQFQPALKAYKQAYRAFHTSGLNHQDLFYAQILRELLRLSLELNQELTRALGYAKEYLALCPQDDSAIYFKAHCHFLLEQYPQVSATLANLKSPDAQLQLKSQLLEARSRFLGGETVASQALFQTLAQTLPDSLEIHLFWARTLYCQNKPNEAIAVLNPFLTGRLSPEMLQPFLLKQRLWCEAESHQIRKGHRFF